MFNDSSGVMFGDSFVRHLVVPLGRYLVVHVVVLGGPWWSLGGVSENC
jgi:hypothetical protein